MEKQKLKLLSSIDDALTTIILLVMIGLLLSCFNLVASCIAHAEEAKPKHVIAVLDTGLDQSALQNKVKLCSTGHFDFSTGKPGIYSYVSKTHPLHGTYITDILAEGLTDEDYCLMILKITNDEDNVFEVPAISAIEYATEKGATIMVYTNAGSYYASEKAALVRASQAGIKIFVAAGNRHENFNLGCRTYPACLDIPEMSVVGALNNDVHADYSNYGKKVTEWFDGNIRDSRGTSFAVPRAVVSYVKAQKQVVATTKTPSKK